MAVVTTANLFTHAFGTLILDPLVKKSAVIPHLTRIDTGASSCFLPRVSGGSVGFVGESLDIPDAGIGADLLEVIPRKLAGLAYTSSESANDAGSSAVLGDALARELAQAADRSFFLAGGGVAPVGLAGVTGTPVVNAAAGAGIDSYASAVGLLEAAGSVATVIFMSPASWTALVSLKESSGSSRPVLSNAATGPVGATVRSLFGVEVAVTAGCPNGIAYVVDGTRNSVVMRTDGNVESDRSFRFGSDVVTIRATMRLGWGFPYAASVVKIAASA